MEHLIQAGSLNPTELAIRLTVSNAAVNQAVDRLVAVGHVERRPDPIDRRRIEVVLVPGAVAMTFANLTPVIAGVSGVLDEFTATERAAIARFLASVNDVYRDASK